MIEAIAKSIQSAPAIVILTGAGCSAESGIPTFRDALSGLWAKYDPRELATLEAFARDPAGVSQWYDERRLKCGQCEPNAGHRALVQLEDWCLCKGKAFTLITQNVDRLHQKAGSRNIIEYHGTLWIWRCLQCGKTTEEKGGPFPGYPLYCSCGGLRRPGVVWFGEELPQAAIDASLEAIERCDLFLSLGTSSEVEPAASLVYIAKTRGAATAEINLEATPITENVDFSLRAKIGESLPEIVRCLLG